MTPSTSNPKEQERNWLDLPTDVTTNILFRIGMVDILENAQKVCMAWRKICKDPAMWRVVNMNDLLTSASKPAAASIFKHVVDRSQGQIVDITIAYDYSGELLFYAADRSSQVRRLELCSSILYGTLAADFFMKFPLLEEVNLYLIGISKEEIGDLGSCCPMLKTLKVNQKASHLHVIDPDEGTLMRLNEIAIAIGQNLVQLRHLELIGNRMTNIGLQVILDNCHHLETLDLRACFNIDLKEEIGKKCSKLIKNLKLPNDSLEGCPYICETDSEASDVDRPIEEYDNLVDYYNDHPFELYDALYEDYDGYDPSDLYDQPFWMD